MSQTSQLNDDLHFVRQTVARRDGVWRRPDGIYWLWAAYVLIGYTLIDFAPATSGWFFMIGGIAGGALSAWIGRRHSQRLGEVGDSDTASCAASRPAGGLPGSGGSLMSRARQNPRAFPTAGPLRPRAWINSIRFCSIAAA